jgi:hypothetical protein
MKRRVWRVKIEEDEKLHTSSIQGAITTQEVIETNKTNNELMSREATIQLVFSILHLKNPFLKMC